MWETQNCMKWHMEKNDGWTTSVFCGIRKSKELSYCMYMYIYTVHKHRNQRSRGAPPFPLFFSLLWDLPHFPPQLLRELAPSAPPPPLLKTFLHHSHCAKPTWRFFMDQLIIIYNIYYGVYALTDSFVSVLYLLYIYISKPRIYIIFVDVLYVLSCWLRPLLNPILS